MRHSHPLAGNDAAHRPHKRIGSALNFHAIPMDNGIRAPLGTACRPSGRMQFRAYAKDTQRPDAMLLESAKPDILIG